MDVRLAKLSVTLPSGKTLFTLRPTEFSAGEKVLIQGPSGRGKTTLLHLIAGLFLPNEGYVFVEGQNLSFLSDEARCGLRKKAFGIIFQRLNLLDHLTALENVLLGLPSKEESEAAAMEALQSLGMAGFAEQYAAHLSLGEQQRIAVARVVAQRPKIVLADEPTSGLDELNSEAVINSLLNLPDRPTLIVVSHDTRLRKKFQRVLDFEEMMAT